MIVTAIAIAVVVSKRNNKRCKKKGNGIMRYFDIRGSTFGRFRSSGIFRRR